MLFVHDDQAEIPDRGEKGRTGADDQADLALPYPFPLIIPCTLRDAAVKHGHLLPREPIADAGDQLGREGDFRDEVDRAARAIKDLGDGPEIDFRLAAARHAVEKAGGEEVRREAFADFRKYLGLIFVQGDRRFLPPQFGGFAVSAGDLLFIKPDKAFSCQGAQKGRGFLEKGAQIAGPHVAAFLEELGEGGLFFSESPLRGGLPVPGDPFFFFRLYGRPIQPVLGDDEACRFKVPDIAIKIRPSGLFPEAAQGKPFRMEGQMRQDLLLARGQPAFPGFVCRGKAQPAVAFHVDPTRKKFPQGLSQRMEVVAGCPFVEGQIPLVKKGFGIGKGDDLPDVLVTGCIGRGLDDEARQAPSAEGNQDPLSHGDSGDQCFGNGVEEGLRGRDGDGYPDKHRAWSSKKNPSSFPKARVTRRDRIAAIPPFGLQGGLLLSLQFFHLLLLHLAVDAQGGYGPRHQTLFRDRTAADIADAKNAIVDPLDGLPHLHDQFSLPVADPKFEIPVRFKGSPVIRVGIILLYTAGHFGYGFSRLLQKFVDLLGQHVSEEFHFFELHSCFLHRCLHLPPLTLGKTSYMMAKNL